MSSGDVLALAARRFVTQDLSGSAELVWNELNSAAFVREPLDLRLKAWTLVTKLAGFAFTAPTKWTAAKIRDTLQNSVKDGSLWNLWPSLSELPPSYMAKTLELMAEHSSNLKPTLDNAEKYLSLLGPDQVGKDDQAAYAQLIETLVTGILASDELGEYTYARELAENFSGILGARKVLDIVGSVETRESDRKVRQEQLAEEEQKRTAELARREQLRVSKAIEESQELVVPDQDLPKEKQKPKPRMEAIGNRQSLVTIWRQSLGKFARSATLKNVIILILVLVSMLSNRPFRQNVRAGSTWLWRALQQSARMGLTVTYL